MDDNARRGVMANHTRRNLFLLSIFAVLHAGTIAAATLDVAPEWKAHFKSNFVIENCVFERTVFSAGTNSSLYQCRFQSNAFIMREISSPADADLDHITGASMYAGRLGSNYWAIEGSVVLKLFPDADKLILSDVREQLRKSTSPASR